ncbi:MAG: HU family DNA-binding protein [Rikenellaceae bacterium]
MTKADIISKISQQTGIEKATVQSIVEAFMESVKSTMAEGNNVYLRGFGSFIIKKRAEKMARNISKNTTIVIPEHNVPAFKPSKTFSAQVKAETEK